MPVCGGGGVDSSSDGFGSRRRPRRRGELHSERGLRGGHSQEVRPEEAPSHRPPQTAAAAAAAEQAATELSVVAVVGGGGPWEVFVEGALGQLRASRHAEAAAAPHAAAGDRGHREAPGAAPAALVDTATVEVQVPFWREGSVSPSSYLGHLVTF